MAKCIQVVGVPMRLSDDDAFQIVERDHDGAYCAKSYWKEWYDKHETEPQRRIARLVGNKITETGALAR